MPLFAPELRNEIKKQGFDEAIATLIETHLQEGKSPQYICEAIKVDEKLVQDIARTLNIKK